MAAKRRSVTVNLAESPLGWLHAHGHLDDRLFDAGERLRGDYETAQISPGITMRWEPVRIRGTAGKLSPGERQIAARERFDGAIKAAAKASRTSCGASSAPARRCRMPKRRSSGPRAAASWCSSWRSTGWRISTGSGEGEFAAQDCVKGVNFSRSGRIRLRCSLRGALLGEGQSTGSGMDRTEAVLASARAQMIYDANKKSVGASYLLCLLLGGLGAHRFYLGHTVSAVVQLILGLLGFVVFVTWPVLWIWLLIDLFLIPGMVRNRNMEIADKFAFD